MLRIGHRPGRDKRVTTHVGLVARAFGAKGFILGDVHDDSVMESLRKVCNQWGGKDMILVSGVNSLKYVKNWKKRGIVIHLTMYGIHIDDAIDKIKKKPEDILVIVGASKVPRIFYEIADYNIAIGHQPHSEVAALAIFMDRLFEGKELHFIYSDAELCIEPSPKEKKVVKCERQESAEST